MATGSYVYRDQYYGQRLILDLSRGSGSTINYTLRLQSTGSYNASTPWSLSGNHSASGTANPSLGGAGTATLATGSFSRSAATTVSASANLFWGGTATVTASIGAAGSPPGPPSNLTWTRQSGNQITLHWDKGSGATTTRLRASRDGGAWYNMSNPSGTSQTVSMDSNAEYRFNARSVNAVGTSSHLYFNSGDPIYTTPPKPNRPTVKVVGTTVEISVTDSARFKAGLEIECSDSRTFLLGSGTGGRQDGYTDTAPFGVDLKYRARRFVGPEGSQTRVFGDWSDWSTPVTAVPAPQITRLTAERCDPTGTLNPLGTYLRVISSGAVADVAGNQFLRRFRRRPVGGSWGSWVTDGQNLAATSWTNRALTLFSGSLVTTAYDIQMQVEDSFTSTSHTVQVSTGETAMSLSRTGVGVGKIWEQGALDVGGDAHISGDAHVEGSLHLADPNEIVIDGTAYQASGTFETTGAGALHSATGWYYRSITAPGGVPSPPPGWTYIWGVASTSGGVAWVAKGTGQIVQLYTVSAASVTVAIAWRLVKI